MGKQLELYDTFPIKIKLDDNKKEIIVSDSDGVKKNFNLVCEVDATHSGTLINSRVYPPELMKRGLKTWTKPYKKPVLTNHDDTQDPIGRVIGAKYIDTPRALEGTEYKPVLKKSDGYGFQRLTVKITDPSAIQKIIDGRYETVSVRMSTNHAFCSICNADWGESGPCEHTPGSVYDKKLAYITTGDLFYKEMSFVNIPADEFAGVREAVLNEGTDCELEPAGVKIYANNQIDKVLSDLSLNDGFNLYSLLEDSKEEGDDIVLHLLDKTSKVLKNDKEEDVKPEELTKDQLLALDKVKELIAEEVAKHQDAKKKSDCEEILKKAQEDCKKEMDALVKAIEECSGGKDELTASNAKLEKEKEELLQKVDSANAELSKKEEDRKKILDENIKINSELHKMVAERLYDLKKTLRKPDVVDVSTPDERDKKVEELAQRSIDSLKDQLADLLLEHEKLIAAGYFGGDISNPGASIADKTNEVEDGKAKKKENKKDTLKRLFSKEQ